MGSELRDWAAWFEEMDETIRQTTRHSGSAANDSNSLVLDSIDAYIRHFETSDSVKYRMRVLLLSSVYGIPTTIVATSEESAEVDEFMAVCPKCSKCGMYVPCAADAIGTAVICLPCDAAEPASLDW